MRKYLNKIVSRLKGESFVIDDSIPITYLISFFLTKFLSLIYGVFIFKTTRLVFVHPSSKVKCKSKIRFGKNFTIGRNCYINALSRDGFICGDNVSMGFHSHVDLTGSLKNVAKGIIIGDNVGLGSHGHFGSGIGGLEIGTNTIIGNYVSFHPENHNFSDLSIPIRLQGVNGIGIKIGENCWIGAKVTILDGTILGNGCIVAAGSVVRDVFPDNVILGGIPAKVIKRR
jgi:acetyltransferase-like isoleucine patch superfamily enzyme